MMAYECSSWSCHCEKQLTGGDATHFPCLKDRCVTQHAAHMKQFKYKITGLLWEFEQRFQILAEVEKDFKVFCSPFTVNASDLLINIQLEKIDLQYDSDLKGKFAAAGLDTFYLYLFICFSFVTTYLCKQVLCN